MSVDVQSLTQKVEFLEFQLEDYQRREAQHKVMYESLLSSLTAEAPRCSCSEEKDHLRAEAEELRRQLDDAQQTARDLDFNLRQQTLAHEKTLLELNKRIVKLESENKELAWKAKQAAVYEAQDTRRKEVKYLRPQMSRLKSELASLKVAWSSEGESLKQLLQESLLCVRDIYEEQLKRLRDQFAETQVRQQTAESSGEETVAVLRENLREKSAELEQLRHTLWQKFAEQRFSCRDCLVQLESKEKQVEELKRLAGELRIQLSSPTSLKPPSPMHSRTVSHSPRDEAPSPQPSEELLQLATYRRMMSSCSKMQCEHCSVFLLPAEFHDHILVCRLEPHGRKTVDETKLLQDKVSQLRSERDRARLESERLLVQLKSAKLDWALTEERKEERNLQLRTHLREIVKVLYRARDALSRNTDLDNALLSLRELAHHKCL